MTTKPPLIENAYIVRDLDKAMRFWIDTGHAGPFFVGENVLGEGCTYRGKPLALHTRYAFGMAGDIAIELIQQMNDAPSMFTEVLQTRGEGLHHLKYATPSRAQEVERLHRQGFEEIARLQLGEITLSFVDVGHGLFHEIMDFELWQPVLQALKRSQEQWDGSTDPVRQWDALMTFMTAP